MDSPSPSSEPQPISIPTTSRQQQSPCLACKMEPDIHPNNSSEQSQMLQSTIEIRNNTAQPANVPLQYYATYTAPINVPLELYGSSFHINMLEAQLKKSMDDNNELISSLQASLEKNVLWEAAETSTHYRIKKLKKVIKAMINIDEQEDRKGKKVINIVSDDDKLRELISLAHEADKIIKADSDDDKEVDDKKKGKKPMDNEEETDEESDSDEEEDEDLQKAIRNSLLQVTGSSSKMGSGSVESGEIIQSEFGPSNGEVDQLYNSNYQQWSKLWGSNESGSSSCQTSLPSDSMKSKSPEDASEISAMNENEPKLTHRKRKLEIDWESEEDMLCSLTSNPEMLLEAVCALYRMESKMHNSRSKVPSRGLPESEFRRLIQITAFLMEGKIGPNKKTSEELENYNTGGLDFCAMLVGTYSSPLFDIYSRGLDDYFC